MKALFLIVLAVAILGTGGYFAYEMFIQPKKALQEEKAQPPPPPPPDPTIEDFEKAKAVTKAGKLVDSREALATFVEHYPESSRIGEAKDLLGNINATLFLSTRPAPEKKEYIVKSGDVISRVAKHLEVSPELLMRTNSLKTHNLQIGQRLTYAPANFSLVISRQTNRVTVLNQGRFFKHYPILLWPPENTKGTASGAKTAPPGKQTGRVRDKVAWLEEKRVIFTEERYWSSKFWIEISIRGSTLYPQPEKGAPETPSSKPTAGGITLARPALTELAALLSAGDPVTLE